MGTTLLDMGANKQMHKKWLEMVRKNSNFLENVITVNKNWIHYFDFLTCQESATLKNGDTKVSKIEESGIVHFVGKA